MVQEWYGDLTITYTPSSFCERFANTLSVIHPLFHCRFKLIAVETVFKFVRIC